MHESDSRSLDELILFRQSVGGGSAHQGAYSVVRSIWNVIEHADNGVVQCVEAAV